MRKEMILLIASTSVCILILLCVSILYHPSWRSSHWHDTNTQFDSELGWAPIPDQIIYRDNIPVLRTNHLGFRSDEVNHSRKQILIVGDSVAWGYGLSDNLIVSTSLSDMLPEYQVLNLGVAGYSIDQYFLSLRRNINQTKPSYILVIITASNDIIGTIIDNANGKSKPLFRWIDGRLVLTKVPLSRHSCLNLWWSSWLFMKIDKMSWGRKIKNEMCPEEKLSDEEASEVIPNLLLAIERLGKEHGAKVFFFISPDYKHFPNGSKEIDYFEDVLSEGQLPYINLFNVLKRNVDAKDISILFIGRGGDWGHYSDLGNMYVATVMKHVVDWADNKTNQTADMIHVKLF